MLNTNRMFRGFANTALLVTVGLSLSACLAGSMPNPEMASVKAPVVRQTLMVHDIGFTPGDLLSSDSRRSLAEWLEGIGVNYGDRVSVDDPNPGASVRRAAIADVLAKYGLLLSDKVPITGSVGSGSARVVVMRATAAVPDCPDWSRPSNLEFEASKYSNYGCADASNLAAMVVDANDLLSGKPHTGTDALTISKAIETYRTKSGKATQTVKSTVGSAGSN